MCMETTNQAPLSNEEQVIYNIKASIEKIRPYINMDGGDLQFVAYKDGTVYVQMLGACAGCMLIDSTLQDGVATILMEEVPEVTAVKLVEPSL